MAQADDAVDTILIVDDEETVRRTFREWLEGADLGCRILAAADAEAALVQANQHSVDLAILDWNLGAGNDGLRLLEDLSVFNPDIVSIMITGYAHQATPLDAMRMGVRDYLDKNQDLDLVTFLAAVRRQLARIRPAKRERQLHRSLRSFREAVEKIVPLVQSASAMHDPVPLPEAVRSLFRFLLRSTAATDGVLLVRSYNAERQPAEIYRAYQAGGSAVAEPLVPFARSLAGTVVSLQQPYMMNLEGAAGSAIELQPFERGRRALLAAPVAVASGIQVVLELFDKQASGGGDRLVEFTAEDQALLGAAADFSAELLRQVLAERQMQRLLFDAIETALGATESVTATLGAAAAEKPDEPPPAPVLERLRAGLRVSTGSAAEAEETVRLAEAVRELAVRHGPAAVQHCIHLVESLRTLLDRLAGAGEPGRE